MSKILAILSATVCTSCLMADGGGPSLSEPQEISLAIPASEAQVIEAAPTFNAEATPAPQKTAAKPVPVKTVEVAVNPFTGKIKGKKVRLRAKADLDGAVVCELKKNDLLTVVGEKGEFWAVQPLANTKAYVFRSFILDNVVEGNRVNVRLHPSTDAPVIGHLNAGEKIHGVVCAANSKWFEIAPPANTHFYVAKEYLENVGGPEIKSQADKRRLTVEQMLEAASVLGKVELQKSFNEMDIDRVAHSYKAIVSEYTDFPEYVEKAREQLVSLQEAYVQRRLAHAEGKSSASDDDFDDNEIKKDTALLSNVQINDKMKMWEPIEEALYLSWAQINEDKNLEQFYSEQKIAATPISGIVEAYTSPVKNKPGDFIVRDKDLPVAYIYSTKVNLQNLVGKKVTLLGCPRSNNNFAFPAFFVIAVE